MNSFQYIAKYSIWLPGPSSAHCRKSELEQCCRSRDGPSRASVEDHKDFAALQLARTDLAGVAALVFVNRDPLRILCLARHNRSSCVVRCRLRLMKNPGG